MGEILLGRLHGAAGFTRKVVLKGLLPELADEPTSVALFRREARLMAQLEHPNIVRVFDVPSLFGKPYLAMEYVRGRNFHQIIRQEVRRRGRVPIRYAAFVVSEALRGLHFAHTAYGPDGEPRAVIHRDISPGNVLVSFLGEVKVTDFGIATVAGTPTEAERRIIRGKARYVAPELIRGKEASVASDLYAAAAVLAEAVTGQPLWQRPNASETFMCIASEPPENTIARIFQALPEQDSLRKLFTRALAPDPADRYPDAAAMADALDEVCTEAGGPVNRAGLADYLRALFTDAPDLPGLEPLDDDEDDETHVGELPVGALPPAFAAVETNTPVSPLDPRSFEAEPAFYLSELLPRWDSTEEEGSDPLPVRRRSSLAGIEQTMSGLPGWVLVIYGIIVGALTALTGSLLALMGN